MIRKLPSPCIPDAAVGVADSANAGREVAAPSPASLFAAPSPEPLDVAAPRVPSRPVVRPVAPDIYKVQFTLSREGHDRLRRAQDLLRHGVPTGDVAVIVERALALLVTDLERQKFAATTKRAPHGARRPGPGTFRRPCGATSGGATTASARS